MVKRKQYFQAALLYAIIFLSNLRYIDPGSTMYGGFHMLPWYGTLIFAALGTLNIPKLPRAIILALALILSSLVAKQLLWDHRDVSTDYFVHYSPMADLSQVVKILATHTPRTVWVEPVNYWVHYQNNSALYTTMINYYRWMDQTPAFKAEFATELSRVLPDIVYLNNQNLALGDRISEYTPLSRDGSITMLYVRNDILSTLSPTERDSLAFYRFTF